jgi:putative ATPase
MATQPLADIMRPKSFDEVVGQSHLVGENGILRKITAAGKIPNMIFFGPPGVGKTTVANIIAETSGMQLYKLNATTASLQDIKDVIRDSDNMFASKGTLLYLDEIQYFNKKQQQSLLEYMESGQITLIASTTENPYYCVYKAVLSRSSVFEFKPIHYKQTAPALLRALEHLNADYSSDIKIDADALDAICKSSGGDVRMAIGILENAYYISDGKISKENIDGLLPSVVGQYDRDGDVHYDLLSCLQKSIRGSDPDAAIFYLAKILASGDILSATRRLLVIASEDIGLAYPQAAQITYALCETAKQLGMPEAIIPLSNATILLATAPKSNTAYIAYHKASEDISNGYGAEIPKHLRSPLFEGYLYPHDYENDFVMQSYLPSDLIGKKYYEFGTNKTEQMAKNYYDFIRQSCKNAKKAQR